MGSQWTIGRRGNAATTWLTAFASAVTMTGTALLPGWTFSGMDFTGLILPQYSWAMQVFHGGEWPLWNPQHWGGAPQLAAMQSMALYPPAVLLGYILAPIPTLHLLTVFHLTLLGAGCGWLARLGGANTAGICLAAATMPLSGFVLGHLEQVNTLAACGWAPWIIAVMLRARRIKDCRAIAGYGALGLLSGHPHYIVLSSALGGLGVIIRGLFPTVGLGRYRRCGAGMAIVVLCRRVGICLCGLGLGGLLAAPQLLPALELSNLSERIWPYEEPDKPRLEIRELPGILIPRYLNRLANTQGRPLGHTESGLFVGPLILGLAGLALMLGSVTRRMAPGPRRIVGTYGILAGTAVVYGLGRVTPVFDWINHIVPTLSSSRGAARTGLVTTLMVTALAGVGLSRLLISVRLGTWTRAGVAVVAVAVQIGGLWWAHSAELKSRYAPVAALTPPNTAEWLPEGMKPKSPGDWTGRIYRFVRDDSNFDLDDRATAVRQRFQRLQPSTQLLSGLSLTEGYEEGLLPTWAYGNFVRRFNRNLRQDRPDPALLDLMGVGLLQTEYPLEEDLGSPFRPPLSLPGGLRGYALEAVPPLVSSVGAEALGEWIGLLRTLEGKAETGGTVERVPTGREVIPLKLPTMVAVPARWQSNNRIEISDLGGNHSAAIVRMWGYPGWQLRKESGGKQSAWVVQRHRAPVMTLIHTGPAENRKDRVVLVFRPYSFQLGLFVGLVTMGAMGIWSFGRLRTGLVRT